MPASEQNSVWTGQCLCGHIHFTALQTPRVHYCHCGMCRRASGGAFAILAWITQHSLTWSVSPTWYRSSPIARRGFCPLCGTPLALQYDNSAEIALLLGAFDQAGELAPQYHYGVESRLPWVDIGFGLPERRTEAIRSFPSLRMSKFVSRLELSTTGNPDQDLILSERRFPLLASLLPEL